MTPLLIVGIIVFNYFEANYKMYKRNYKPECGGKQVALSWIKLINIIYN